MAAGDSKEPTPVHADFEIFFLKDLTTKEKVQKLLREEKLFKKIKFSLNSDSSADRSLASFVLSSDQLYVLTGNFTYELENRPGGYQTEMRHRDFQSRLENLFLKSMIKFYFRVTSDCDRLIPMNLNPDQKIKTTGLSFGSLLSMHTFVEHVDIVKLEEKDYKFRTSRDPNDLYIRFLNGKNKLNVYFKLYSKHQYQQHYKFSLDYDGMSFVVVSPGEERDMNGRFVKFLDLIICYHKSPLLLFNAITDGDNMKPQKYSRDYKSRDVEPGAGVGKWMRCLTVPGIDNDSFGRSSVLKLRVHSVKEYQYESVTDGLKTDPLHILSCLSYFARCPIYWSNVDTVSAKPAVDLKDLNDHIKKTKENPFPLMYALQGIFSLSHHVSDTLTICPSGEKEGDRFKRFSKHIRTFAFKNGKALEETLYDAFRVLEKRCALDILDFLPKRFEDICKDPARLSTPSSNIQMIRRVFITPSRVICAPPEPQLASWFLRELDNDCLIRVYFRDENNELYTFTCNPQKFDTSPSKKPRFSWQIMLNHRVLTPVVNGLPIAGKMFEYLVCSSSMLRSHALMMYAEDSNGNDAKFHAKKIGDVKESVKTVAKYIARSGQAVSQPIGRIEVCQSKVHFNYPDTWLVENHKQKYNFTDGIGMMSAELAREVAQKMKWKIVPSALQIRYAGAKGVVAIDPRLPNLEGHEGKHLILRQSMVKFVSQSNSLEILKCSQLRPIHLNKSFIMVLDQLGIVEEVFMELLLNKLNMACQSFLSEASALETLKTHTSLHIPMRIKQILDRESCINVLREPFFRKCLGVVTREMVLELKSKARIKMPLDAGRHMIGVTDETKTLEYGQVFVQYTKYNSTFSNEDPECEILEGEVLVTKAPTMVVGDVRKFKAVNIPALHHHRDVVVFPQKGMRPHPDEMAGSDLDGDEYAVIWYKPLIFIGHNRQPLDYEVAEAKEDKVIDVKPIMNYILKYMQQDSVGLIATTHLARSDRDRDGTDPINLRLALKYSKALDAVKSGHYQKIEPRERAEIHPDFMGKEAHGPTYVSERVLGTIYRHVCLYEMAVCDFVTIQPVKQPDALLTHKDWKKYEKSANESFDKYSAMIHSLLKQYRVEDEASLLTQSFTGTENGKELRDFRKTIDKQIKDITNNLREEFESEFLDVEDGPEKESMRQAKASAWYIVTQEKSTKSGDCPILGLPWIVGNYLADLSLEDAVKKSDPKSMIEEMMDQLDNSLSSKFDQTGMELEQRIEEALEILTKWLTFQAHLQFETEEQRAKMIAEVHDVVDQIRKAYIVNRNVMETPTIGYLVIQTMIQMSKPVLERTTVRAFSHETYEIEGSLNFAFLQSLVKLFRSGDSDHVLTARYPMPKEAATFYLGIESKYQESFAQLNMHQQNFHVLIKRLTGVDEVQSSFENLTNARTRKVRFNAFGYKWNLIQLRSVLSQSQFCDYLLNRLDQMHQKQVLESKEKHGIS